MRRHISGAAIQRRRWTKAERLLSGGEPDRLPACEPGRPSLVWATMSSRCRQACPRGALDTPLGSRGRQLSRFGATALASAAALALAGSLPAQEPAAPIAGFRAEFLAGLAEVEEKLAGLAEAVPAEKYTWRPAEGVRSVSEVYMHVAGGNYFIPRSFGAQPPEGIGRDLETVTDKAKVVETLRQSIAHVRRAVLATPDSDLDREVDLFGGKSTVRGAMSLLANHMHEHLGQSIAYARMLGVTPPWSRGGS